MSIKELAGQVIDLIHENAALKESINASVDMMAKHQQISDGLAAEVARLQKDREELIRLMKDSIQVSDTLQEQVKLLRDAMVAYFPYIPTTSASEGGAAKYSGNVLAADMIREALAATEPATLHKRMFVGIGELERTGYLSPTEPNGE